MVKLSFGQQQRLKTICQHNRKPMSISQPTWDDLLHGYLVTLEGIDLVILWEAIGLDFSRAMKRSQDKLEQ